MVIFNEIWVPTLMISTLTQIFGGGGHLHLHHPHMYVLYICEFCKFYDIMCHARYELINYDSVSVRVRK